jgi:hypothetical protein
MDIRHRHAPHHFSSGALALVLKFDSCMVLEAIVIRQMCARLGVGGQFSAPYAHDMLGKAERPWRTIQDSASVMMIILNCHYEHLDSP